MPVYHGNNKIEKIYKGSTRLWRAYKGSQLVFGYEPNDVLFESSTAGTYTFNMEYGARVNVILVGAGGGGSSSKFAVWLRGRNGGQGSMVSGDIILEAGTYTIVIGKGGQGDRINDTGGRATGEDGGNSTFLGNTAGGGKGSYCHTGYYDSGYEGGGEGGTATVVTSGFTGSNGADITTTSKYGSYGGGGLGNNNEAQSGQNGYCKITVLQEA